ncbi:NAD(P)-dependent oxidoreductase [Nocardia jinanensis]|uniref:D-isomer specific 2-hydroxyacid dehydrogenase NAD-binding domain-containing protein n=1 Tax=Nocardia jinanensis TaxID=382504 RepID=A0A917VM41_9NOCA|nr:NAD(P)-dependent oxidoreductase [Nocardia jinanensis]GGK99022.1 hypothetical protein GCM10011588_12030 [Nocardia jinanensis]
MTNEDSVLISTGIGAWSIEAVSARYPGVRIGELSEHAATAAADTGARRVALIGPRPPADGDRAAWERVVLDAEWVHVTSAGIDAIPLDLLQGKVVTCGRGGGSGPIAEYVVAALLSDWKGFTDIAAGVAPETRVAAGSTVGFVGFGEIARATAARLAAFDVDMVAVRRTGTELEHGVRRVGSLEELLPLADALVLAVPLTDQTRGMIGPAEFAAMSAGVHLVNVARGPVVQTDALIEALHRGTVRRATLDVTDPEPVPDEHPLKKFPQVTLTGRIAGNSPGVQERIMRRFGHNLGAFLSGEPMQGAVDLAAGY